MVRLQWGPFLAAFHVDRHGLLEDRKTERGALSCPCFVQPPLAAPGLAYWASFTANVLGCLPGYAKPPSTGS